MTAAALPTRMLLLLGLAVAALATALVARSFLLAGDAVVTPLPVERPAVTPKPAGPATTPAKPKIVLLPGLPAPVARELQEERVVVVALYASKVQLDRSAASQARSGAGTVGAGFAALDLSRERVARAASTLAGPVSTPSVLVVRRPGTVVAQFDGYVDSAVVAQAAQSAGAGR